MGNDANTTTTSTSAISSDLSEATQKILDDLKVDVGYGFENMNSTINTVGAGVQMFSSLASVYAGFKQLDLAEEELEMKKEQMALAMNEATRARNVTSNLTAAFG